MAWLLVTCPAWPEDVYQQPDAFVADIFAGSSPERETLWFTKEMRADINRIMQRNYPVMRTYYWRGGGKTVWILEEIGKTRPITTGIVVQDGRIEQIKVLIYRESHGAQVRQDYFTRQFHGATLEENAKLSQPVDNISGATMSSDALRNLGALALYLDKHVTQP